MGLIGRVSPEFWKNKKVFVTGHTGFKGSWTSLWLQSMGAIVKGYAYAPNTKPDLFTLANVADNIEHELGDIRDIYSITKSMKEFDPEVVLHMAAQPLVRYSYINPVETYETNVMGTVNVLEAAKSCNNLIAIVSVTTDKCYENKEWVWGYRENEPMGGHDPYSSSKGCAELVCSAYRQSYFASKSSPNLASARAGNVIGGGDWAEDRLVPDILRAFENNKAVVVRNPLATRPWQHVLEPISGYFVLAQALFSDRGFEFAEGWNFGPTDEDCKPVNWILDTMTHKWGEGACWEVDQNENPHEAGYLKLDTSKAKQRLKWESRWRLVETLETIIDWHRKYLKKENMQEVCLEEIKRYTSN